jgi:hypothetical protein
MVQGGSSLCLVHQPLPGLRITGPPLGQHLDGNLAPELTVFGEEDISHTARAEFPNDSVVTDL